MLSFKGAALTLATVLFTVASSYTIEPDSVSLTIRQSWCDSETTTCPSICQQLGPGDVKVNTCDPETLTYGCLCANDQKPNITQYTLTMPYFVCTEWGNQCVTDCGDDSACASSCREDHPCGASDPYRGNKTAKASETASVAPTASTTDENTIYSAGAEVDPDKQGAGAALEAGRGFGMAMVISGLFVGFALL